MGHGRKWLLVRVLAVLALLSLVAAGCGGTEADQAEEPGTDEGGQETPDAGETGDSGDSGDAGGDGEETEVVIAVDTDITTTDCQLTSGLLDRWILENYCESILARSGGDESEIVPHIVTDWEISEDELVWTFNLRDDVYFHTGEHFTAEDLKASVERITDPALESSQANFWEFVDEVVVVDDYTAEFHLSEPNPLMIVFSERLPLIPKSLFDEIGATEYTGEEPVGLGAYKLVEWSRDDRIVFEAFDDYFLGRPEIDRVIFRTIPDEAARVAALRAGEADIIFPVSPHQVEQIESDPNLVVYEPLSLERVRVSIDTRREPFTDPRVRQAINHAVDVDGIIESLIPGAVRICGPLVPEEEGFNPDLECYEYDPERARELLAEAGHPDGIGPVEFSVSRGYANAEEISQAITANLAEVGIQTEMRVYDAGDFGTRKREKFDNPESLGPLQFDGHAGGNTFHGYHHLMNVVGCDGSPVHSGYYCNEEVDQLILDAVAMWTADQDAAIGNFHEAQELIVEDAWAGFLFQMPRLYGVDANLNWEPDSSGQMKMRLASWE